MNNHAEEPLDHWLDDPKYRKILLELVEIYNPETKEVSYGRFCSGCFRWIPMGTKKSNADNSSGRKCLQCSNADKKDKTIENRKTLRTFSVQVRIDKKYQIITYDAYEPVSNVKWIND
jgi:hypothetical protein